jgi:AcrR family transcriptional regulator
MARPAAYDREDVLAKAMRLFWAKGYQGTSIKDLEQALNLRPGSIYSGFGSKENLYAEALRVYADASRHALEQTLADAVSPLHGLADYVRSLGCAGADAAPSRACMLMKTVLETPDGDLVLRPSAEHLMRMTEQAFADVFRRAQDAGELPAQANPDRLATRLQSQIMGLRAYAQRTDAAERAAQLAEDIANDLLGLARPGA